MIKIADKMPITIILLVFSYLAPVCGIAASVWFMFRYRDPASLIYGFLILVGCLLLAALIRMFANIGQMIFDIRVDMQNSLRAIQNSFKDTQDSFRQARESADARNEALIRNLQSIVEELQAVRDNFNQMNCDSRDMNQNIHQIRDFFEQIERHLDLKK